MVWLEGQGFPADTSYRVVTVVDELFCNTMEYSGAHYTAIQAETQGQDIALSFRDDGIAFDPFEAGQRDYALYLSSDTDRRLGLYLINRLARELHYQRLGPENVVDFVVPAEPPDPLKRAQKRA
jgi:anti-sigma regulatory factor (Ser/Thr protein kinase)